MSDWRSELESFLLVRWLAYSYTFWNDYFLYLRRCLATRREEVVKSGRQTEVCNRTIPCFSVHIPSSTLFQYKYQKVDRKSKDFVGRVQRHSNRHTPKGSASCVQSFDDSLDIQFALRIAFRCVLHRYGSLDIRCWKWFWLWFHEKPKLTLLKASQSTLFIMSNKGHVKTKTWQITRIYRFTVHKVDQMQTTEVIHILSNLVFSSSLETREESFVVMILPQVHLRKPCYDFTFL